MSASGSALRPGPLDRRLANFSRATPSATALALVCGVVQLVAHVGIALLLAQVFAQLLNNASVQHPAGALVGLVLLFATSLGAQWGLSRALARVSDHAMSTLNAEVLAKLTRGIELSGERAGGLAIALTSGLSPLRGYFSKYLPALVQAVLTPLLLLSVVAVLDPIAAVMLVIGLAALPVITSKVAARANASAAKQWRALYSLSARYGELLHGLTTLRLLNATSRARREVEAATTNYATTTMKTLKLAFQSSLAAEFTTGVAVGLTAMVVGFQLLAGTTSTTSAFTIVLLAAEIYAPLRRTSAEFHNAASGRAAAATLFDLIDEPLPDILESVTFDEESTTLTLHAVSVELGDGRATPPLSGVLVSGEVLTISGVSGAGKSTLLHALAAAVGDRAALMPQRIDVFGTTVAQNLVLDGRSVDVAERDEICRATGFDRVVEQLREGFDTMLGDGGVSLSAGELRKLGLTRALLSNRPIIILDEPTANLDEASIEHLRESLRHLVERRIVVMSAHGPSQMLTPNLTHDVGVPR